MYNDSIEILLLRHYGHDGPTPDALEQRLINSVRQDAMGQQERAGIRVLKHRISRRRAVKLVAVGSGGLGLLAASLEVLDETIFGRDAPQSALA